MSNPGLTDVQRDAVQAKERLNPAITFFTYEEVLTLLKNTLSLIQRLSTDEEGAAH
jgi:hypothetical protein